VFAHNDLEISSSHLILLANARGAVFNESAPVIRRPWLRGRSKMPSRPPPAKEGKYLRGVSNCEQIFVQTYVILRKILL